jgi:hypothetical protein
VTIATNHQTRRSQTVHDRGGGLTIAAGIDPAKPLDDNPLSGQEHVMLAFLVARTLR